MSADAFWARVDKSGDCWLWTGYRTRDGYGRTGKTSTHRFSWSLANGQIPRGMYVCHRCDVKLCVRPAHLFLGTAADNNADMRAKGRQRGPSSESRHTAKLDAKRAAAMRIMAAGGVPARTLAPLFGVSVCTVHNVTRGKTWKAAGGPLLPVTGHLRWSKTARRAS